MFDLHTDETAPADSAELLRKTKAAIGFVPNIYRLLAEAPVAHAAYEHIYGAFNRDSAFSPLERQIVMMTANRANGCDYCMAGHSMMMTAAKMPAQHIRSLRDGMPLDDARLEALRSFTADLLDRRGHLSQARVADFLAAGYTRQQALEILVGLAAKLIANFASSLADLPLDAPAEPFAWSSDGIPAAA